MVAHRSVVIGVILVDRMERQPGLV